MVIKDRNNGGDIIVYFNVNLKLLTKLINSAFVGVSELRRFQNERCNDKNYAVFYVGQF